LYAHAGAELTRNLSHRDVRGAGVVLNPCKSGHRIVTCNGTADLTTEDVQNGAARGIFDDELDQVHGGIGKASGGFDEENGRCWGSSTKSPRVGRYRARLSTSRSERTLDSPGMERPRIAGEGAARAEVLHGLPGGGPNGGVVSGGIVPERGETGVVGGRKDEGLLGKDGEDRGARGSDGVEQVDVGIANGMDVEELTGRAVKAVKWYVVGVDCATTRTENGARGADVRRRGRK
jgi:hypothetical protein